MRRVILTTLFVSIAPLAYAQSNVAKAPMPSSSTSTAPAAANGSENCGTPDEFKACPPLPRRNLPYYPGTKH
jgi:hypothetical protein